MHKIELVPVNSLESLFGAFPDLDVEWIRREHEDEIKIEGFKNFGKNGTIRYAHTGC